MGQSGCASWVLQHGEEDLHRRHAGIVTSGPEPADMASRTAHFPLVGRRTPSFTVLILPSNPPQRGESSLSMSVASDGAECQWCKHAEGMEEWGPDYREKRSATRNRPPG